MFPAFRLPDCSVQVLSLLYVKLCSGLPDIYSFRIAPLLLFLNACIHPTRLWVALQFAWKTSPIGSCF